MSAAVARWPRSRGAGPAPGGRAVGVPAAHPRRSRAQRRRGGSLEGAGGPGPEQAPPSVLVRAVPGAWEGPAPGSVCWRVPPPAPGTPGRGAGRRPGPRPFPLGAWEALTAGRLWTGREGQSGPAHSRAETGWGGWQAALSPGSRAASPEAASGTAPAPGASGKSGRPPAAAPGSAPANRRDWRAAGPPTPTGAGGLTLPFPSGSLARLPVLAPAAQVPGGQPDAPS